MLGDLSCSPDGKLVVTSANRKIYLWSTITREIVTVLDGDQPFIFSPESRCLTYVMFEKKIVMIDLTTHPRPGSSPCLNLPAMKRPVSPQQNDRSSLEALEHIVQAESPSKSDPSISEPHFRKVTEVCTLSGDLGSRASERVVRFPWLFSGQSSSTGGNRVLSTPAHPARYKQSLVFIPVKQGRRSRQQDNHESESASVPIARGASSESVVDVGCCHISCFKKR